MKTIIKIIFLLTLLSIHDVAYADQLVQQFKDPSFSGNGWINSAMTTYQQEQANKSANANALASAQAAAANAAANTPLAKFISLFESQVYSQLATQLSNNLFSTGTSASNVGTFNLAGNTISYVKTNSNVTLTVVDTSGNQTIVTVPIATFAF